MILFNDEAVIAEDPMLVISVHSMCRFHPVVTVSLAGESTPDDAAKVGNFIEDFYTSRSTILLKGIKFRSMK